MKSLLLILSLNVAGIPLIHPHLGERIAATGRYLRESGYDIVVLQEAWRDKDAKALQEASGLPYYARYERSVALGTGLALLSRYPIIERDQALFTCRPSLLRASQGESIANKGVLMARVQTPSGPLDVYDTHLISRYEGARYRTLRLSQVFELAEFVLERSRGRPAVILGDLNSPPGDAAYATLIDLLGLQDVCEVQGRDACGRTHEFERIDHAFLPAGNRPMKLRAKTVLQEPIAGTSIPYSDHFGLEASLDPARLNPVSPDPKRRAGALRRVEAAFGDMIAAMTRRQAARAWIPVYGLLINLRYDHQLTQLWSLKYRAETARIRAKG